MNTAAYYIIKVMVSAVLIVMVSEVSKRSSLLGGLVASLPLVSLLAIIWLYVETKDSHAVGKLATGIFWLVLPSLVLFIALPWLLAKNVPFWWALAASCGLTVAAYYGMLGVMGRFGLSL